MSIISSAMFNLTTSGKIQLLSSELARALEEADRIFCTEDHDESMDDMLEDASIAAQDLSGDMDGMDERLSKVIETLEKIGE